MASVARGSHASARARPLLFFRCWENPAARACQTRRAKANKMEGTQRATEGRRWNHHAHCRNVNQGPQRRSSSKNRRVVSKAAKGARAQGTARTQPSSLVGRWSSSIQRRTPACPCARGRYATETGTGSSEFPNKPNHQMLKTMSPKVPKHPKHHHAQNVIHGLQHACLRQILSVVLMERQNQFAS